MPYMLDTNTVSHFLKGHPAVTRAVVALPMAALCISAITEGELLFGLAKRPEASRLHRLVHEFLHRVDVAPWGSAAAQAYGTTRAALEKSGTPIASHDLLIAAHAIARDATLVTNDQSFAQIPSLKRADWTL